MKKLIFIFFIIFSISFAASKPKSIKEYRAMWVTRYELTSQKNISNIVQKAVDNNFNALFVQVCGRGTAFYESKILPKDNAVTNFDPLAALLKKANKHDLEIHAWVNILYVWSAKEMPKSKNHVVNNHKQWILNYGQKKQAIPTG